MILHDDIQNNHERFAPCAIFQKGRNINIKSKKWKVKKLQTDHNSPAQKMVTDRPQTQRIASPIYQGVPKSHPKIKKSKKHNIKPTHTTPFGTLTAQPQSACQGNTCFHLGMTIVKSSCFCFLPIWSSFCHSLGWWTDRPIACSNHSVGKTAHTMLGWIVELTFPPFTMVI